VLLSISNDIWRSFELFRGKSPLGDWK
jgi:hypothetical protein